MENIVGKLIYFIRSYNRKQMSLYVVITSGWTIKLEVGIARALSWTRIGDGEILGPASSNALLTSSQLHLVLRMILAIRRPLII